MLINIGICDDNPNIVKTIKDFILNSDLEYDMEIYTAHSGEEFLEKYSHIPFNIAFLDIEMEELNGIELGEKLKKLEKNIIIVYITGHGGYAVNAFKIKAFDYIMKPISKDSFLGVLNSTINRLNEISTLESIKKDFVFKYKKELISLKYSDIYYFEKSLNKIKIYTEDNVFQIYSTLKKILSEVDNEIFIHSSEKHIINIKKLSKIQENSVVLGKNLYSVSLSRNRRKNLMDSFSKELFKG